MRAFLTGRQRIISHTTLIGIDEGHFKMVVLSAIYFLLSFQATVDLMLQILSHTKV